MKARKGMTLVEVMLAGAIAGLVMLSLMEGLVVVAKLGNENSRLLAAEAYAWDTAWKWLNKSNENLNGAVSWQWYPSSQGRTLTSAEANEECPELNEWPGSTPKIYIRARARKGSDFTAPPHGVAETEWKEIEVDVEWGPAGDRKRLNAFGSNSISNFNIPIRVCKGPIERGEE